VYTAAHVANTIHHTTTSEEVEADVKEAAEVSMGTEVADEDIENIQSLCDQVITIYEYRSSLFEYLCNRMHAIAPNLTAMVGELVGARLIAHRYGLRALLSRSVAFSALCVRRSHDQYVTSHTRSVIKIIIIFSRSIRHFAHSGSLLSLAKHPASTIQILGAEKALFRALKTKHDTPKYGLIYHASLVGQAAPKHKGKISRVLAAKTALSVRMDALGDAEGVTIGAECRAKVQARLAQLDDGKAHSLSGGGGSKAGKKDSKVERNGATLAYNTNGDTAMSSTPVVVDADAEKKAKKAAKKAKKEKEAAAAAVEVAEPAEKAKKSKKGK
jgi:nucleolar protein 58